MEKFYNIDEKYQTLVAYFNMEYAIHQSLKTYSGGLGFLVGSHFRSAYDLKQNMIGIGILWSYGYYDQTRSEDGTMSVAYRRKEYYFLDELNVKVSVIINQKEVFIKAFLLKPETFGSAPLLFLTTDIEENDFLARTITHKLYDANEETRIAQEIVLGIGGVKILEQLEIQPDIYHMNEGHSLPLIFELYSKIKDKEALKQKVVFTTHTPEKAGNEDHSIPLLEKMGFFNGIPTEEAKKLVSCYDNDRLNLTLSALRSAKISNAVSKIHGKIANSMWQPYEGVSNIISITNAQNRRFWADKVMIRALDEHEDYEVIARKKHLKRLLFDVIANQSGKMFDTEILTIVWARRFVGYKRPGLIKYDTKRFINLLTRSRYPIQIIFAGKPHPQDSASVNLFNELVYFSKTYKRMAVLVDYELELSSILKKGADLWLNTPRLTREASGTSGMTACMNGSIHFSINAGWHPEFAQHEINCFTIPECNTNLLTQEQDEIDNKNMMDMLEDLIIPLYYENTKEWVQIMKNSMNGVLHQFDSGRMAHEYYTNLYNYKES